MSKLLVQVVVLVTSLILTFILFYAVFERSTRNKTEREILEIYEAQLESILFSINQYNQDIVESWVNQINQIILSGNLENEDALLFLSDHPSVDLIFISDNQYKIIATTNSNSQSNDNIEDLLKSNLDAIKPLPGYLEADYQKLLPLLGRSNNFYIVFALKEDPPGRLAGLMVNPTTFISEVLSPRLQEVARDEMILSAFNGSDSTVYSTNSESVMDEEVIRLPDGRLLFFPSYYLGISFRGETLNDLIDERTRNDVLFIMMISIVLIVGIAFIFAGIQKELRLSKMKSDFVSNVSHEIRTPLALISMFAETLEMDRVKDEKERNKFYHIINSETRRLSGLVNRILNFSKMEAGKRSYEMATLNLNDVVGEVMLSHDYHLKNLGFTVDFDRGENVLLEGDRDSIYEAVVNLLDNAMKYSADSKNILIKTVANVDSAIFSITDFGMGIPKSEQKKIFNKFYRAEDSLVHNTKGSGLGLNIVYEIMKAHNGNITMDSKPGKGSTFELHFQIKSTG